MLRTSAFAFLIALGLAACVGDGPVNPQDSGADSSIPQGTEGGPCFPNSTCNAGLTCTLVNGTGVCTASGDATTNDVTTSDAPADTGSSDAADAADGPCVSKNCNALGYQCGQHYDNCNQPLDCGSCTSPQTCNSAGQCI